MPATVPNIVSGAYFAYWGAGDYLSTDPISYALGNTQTGIRVSHNYQGRDINFDALGAAPADSLFLGVSMTIDFVLMEWGLGGAVRPGIEQLRWNSFTGATLGYSKPAGGSLWERAKPLVLRGCFNNIDPQEIVFFKTILMPGFDLDTNYSHIERVLPVRMMVFPVGYEAEIDPDNPIRPIGCSELAYFEETNWP